MRIHIWHTGLVYVDSAIPFRNSSKIPGGFGRGRKHKMLLPVSSYLIEHPLGKILVDTGWSERVRTNPVKETGITYTVSKPNLPYGWSIREHLTRMQLEPEEIDYLILSHLDSDHVSGLKSVKNARNILVSATEYKNSLKFNPRYVPKMWQGTKLTTFEYQKSKLGPFGRSYDLFGDDTVQLIATPGHSRGLTSIRLKNEQGNYILLASDVAYEQENISKYRLPGILANVSEEISSLGWVINCTNDKMYSRVILNHDQRLEEEIIDF